MFNTLAGSLLEIEISLRNGVFSTTNYYISDG